jgi:2-oxoglutarate/2-oxoacid ferredoxin oxidoreductase subunit beta
MSHGFNALHGRMPSVAQGVLVANHTLRGIGVSGDGDTGSIGLGQFKHLLRRNARMVYVIENNGVYGLTKGQFSATADEGLRLKYAGHNDLPPIDLCQEAIAASCGFVARSFAGDAKQVRELLKAAFSHRGTAVLDVISPCVSFNNDDESPKSYVYGRHHERPLQELGFIAPADEIVIGETEPGELTMVDLHDGSRLKLRKVEESYDPTDRAAAMARLIEAERKQEFITGLLYYDDSRPSYAEAARLPETPLALLPDDALRPPPAALERTLQRYR